MAIDNIPSISTELVREHYDRLSVYYKTFWGEHIHHGYWEDNESIDRAQVQLVERLAQKARITSGSRVLDVGCGIGGSAFWIAKNFDCSVLGLTISPAQAALAQRAAVQRGCAANVRFEVMDADRLEAQDGSFDVIWVMESSEHFRNKPRFFRRCYDLLNPGGVVALCAWLSGSDLSEEHQALVERVCRGMLCPSLGTFGDHITWLKSAGFIAVEGEDCTRRVERTWDYVVELLQTQPVRALLHTADDQTREFINAFSDIRRAYAEDAMAYGMFTARKQ